jgi:hypothetical protein
MQMNKTYLIHYGISGQRWGIRRFQNRDGTLTSLGKKRYGDPKEHGNSISNKEGKKILVKDYKRADAQAAETILSGTSKTLKDTGDIIGNIGKNKSKTVNKADYSKLSDEELRKKINRLNMERSYGELTGDTKRVRNGQDWTREILQTTGAVAGVAATIALTIKTMNEIKLEKGKG